MKKIAVQLVASGHELWVNRVDIRRELGSELGRMWDALCSTWQAFAMAAAGYVLALLIGALLTGYGYRWADERGAEYQAAMAAEVIHVTEPQEKFVPYGEQREPYKAEAEAVARVVYGMAKNRSREGQQAVAWLIVNRVESGMFPASVVEVCEQGGQWVGYSPDNPVMEEIYQNVYEVLEEWHEGGHRSIGPEYLWINWSANAVELVSSFGAEGGLRYE